MKVHHVHGNTKGLIRTRTTSCYCDACAAGNHHDVSHGNLINGILWKSVLPDSANSEKVNGTIDDISQNKTVSEFKLHEHDLAAVVYDAK